MERSQPDSKSGAPLVGNARFEGLLVDLVEELATAIGFSFVFEPVESVRDMVTQLVQRVSGPIMALLGQVPN